MLNVWSSKRVLARSTNVEKTTPLLFFGYVCHPFQLNGTHRHRRKWRLMKDSIHFLSIKSSQVSCASFSKERRTNQSTVSTTMTSSPESPLSPSKRTVGEELFLVHLHRQTPEDAIADKDFGIDAPPRKRSKSIGEELFEVHLKRCEGVEPDYDVSKPETEKPAAKQTKKKKAASSAQHVIHLRNRDVPPMAAH